jgi:predicted nucleotidyltransferase
MDLQESLKVIKNTVRQQLPEESYEIFVYGSRAAGNAQKWSDIDIGIKGEKEISTRKLALIAEALDLSKIPYKVDVVDVSKTSNEFRNLALKKVIKL